MTVKCVVWDLDNTVWDGTLLEDPRVVPRPGVVDMLVELDRRGILQSIASRNDRDTALARLKELGLDEYFLHPQIGWNPKSASVATIAERLNIGLDALAFVDDEPFELAEVTHVHPQVLCVPTGEIAGRLDTPELTPRFVTTDSERRRAMYRSGEARDVAEESFDGAASDFLSTLGMVLTLSEAQLGDLERAEELTVRTNQLNSTGVTYSYEELLEYQKDPDHLLLMAGLDDCFGTYGKIGLALVERGSAVWTLKLLLMSCRVMSRGIGTVILGEVVRMAAAAGAVLRADFVPTSRNRVMYVTFRFAGFREVSGVGQLEADPTRVQGVPCHLQLVWE